jgi:antitoxin Phd
MKTLTATAARARFGELIDMAQAEPVRITRRGRDVAIVLSPEEFRRISEAATRKVNPAVKRLHAESVKRFSRVYEALAK